MISLTDSSGTLLNINKYDEYGVPQSGNSGKFGYTGQAWVPEIGLWYYKARFYNPIGRFMQTDPIGYASGMNMYAYVGNDPINWVDPLGLKEICRYVNVGSGWVKMYCWQIDLSPPPHLDPATVGYPPEDRGEPGDRNSPEEEARQEECEELEQKVNETKSALSGFITNFPIWNDIKRLQSQLNWVQGDLAKFNIAQWVVLGGSSAGGAGRVSGRIPSFGIGRFGGALGVVIGGLTGAALIVQPANLQRQINALNARLAQLNAQRAGRCP